MDTKVVNKPTVSVLTPMYNTEEKYLRACIESVLNQTFGDFEFLLLNDSPDNKRLKEIVESYQDERIKYLENEQNLGISKSRNKLLELAQGEYIAILDHDDVCYPTRFEKQVCYLDLHQEIGVCGTFVRFVGKNVELHDPTDNYEIKLRLMQENVLRHTSLMIRSSVIEQYHIRYEELYSPAEDYKLVLTLAKYTMFHIIGEVLVDYSWYENNSTMTQFEKMKGVTVLCHDYADKEFPFLANLGKILPNQSRSHKSWIRLFGVLPIIKIKEKDLVCYYLLFGFINLFSIKKYY